MKTKLVKASCGYSPQRRQIEMKNEPMQVPAEYDKGYCCYKEICV
jgi:hypothetical protein